MNIRLIILTNIVSLSVILTGFAGNSADVIVYGSTPGGFCAAIAAAREGASVILLEPSDHVGGLSTGGLSHCDSNQMVRSTLMGLFDEWHRRVVKDYTDRGLPAPYDPAIKDTSKWTFEPHVATRVTMRMLNEAGVTVLTKRYLKSVTKDGPRITSLVTKNGTFTAKVYVDGSYEGDLMAAAGVEWTIGRESRAEFGESLAGKRYPKKKMGISGFGDDGKLLPLVTTDDAGPEDGGDRRVMTYSFRLCLTSNADNLIPMPKPANYDPSRFEVVRRYLKSGGDPKQVGIDLYPLPGGKIDGNNGIGRQFSTGLVGGCNDWHSADEMGRQKIWEAHKQYTLEFIHFLKTDPVVPGAIRDQYVKLGLCKDEFANNDHFSPALYVRESRRMKGLYVISQKDIMESPKKDDPIAISSFPIDSHDVQRVALKGGGVINEGTILPVRVPGSGVGHAYHVPYRSVLPKKEECENLLVPVALSCTHVGMASLRIEGAWMVIGQGAGIAAALAAKRDVAVQGLPYAVLRERLIAQGQILDLPEVSPKADARNRTAGKPNVLLIAIDDLNDWVGCLGGHPQAVTPNIDRLAARGMLFSNAHSQGTLCNPSRISVLWGRRPSSTGFYDNHYLVSSEPAFLKSHVSLPVYFTNNGYDTLTAGKVFNSGNSDARGQSQVLGPDPGYWRNGLDKEIHKRPADWHAIWDFGPQEYDETEFTDHIIASWAVKKIGEKHDRPFFLSVGFYRPHVPFFPPRRLYDQVGDVQLPPVKENDWNDLPDAARRLTMTNPKIPAHDWMLQEDRWKLAVKAYLACVRWTDEQVGRVLDALDASPNAGNTVVVLFSDHGYHLGEKQRWEKFSLWERSTHVPSIISVPGGSPGKTSAPVELLSIYPTLVELCCLPQNPKLEGVSLRPLLENPNATWEHVAISTLGQNNHAVRDERWRYIHYADGSEELYDHRTDPNEWCNLAFGKLDAEQMGAIGRLKSHIPDVNNPQRGKEAGLDGKSSPSLDQ